MRRYTLVLAVAAAFAAFSCGGSSTPTDPGGDDKSSTTTTGPAPTPRPTPATSCSTCEAPVSNSNPPVRIHVRMYLVRKPNGDPAPCINEDPVAPGTPLGDANVRYWFAAIPVGYRVRIDATAYDQFDKPTNGDCILPNGQENPSCINWRFGHGRHLIDEYALGHLFQPSWRVIGEGDFQIQAEMLNNGVRIRSPWYWLNFIEDASESPCSGPPRS